MSELEGRLNSILSDPEQMARINSLAQSLMGGAGDAPPSGDAGGESAPESALPGDKLHVVVKAQQAGEFRLVHYQQVILTVE